jgi:hypothetical protein
MENQTTIDNTGVYLLQFLRTGVYESAPLYYGR